MAAQDIEPFQFQPGQSGNPNGRPKKSFSLINEQLKSEGYEPLTKAQLVEAYSLIFNCDEERLKALGSDTTLPYALRLIIIELNDKKNRAKALQDYRDYVFGRAKENMEVNSNEVITIFEIPDNGRDRPE